MSSLSVMEWNAKPPLQWEWVNTTAAAAAAPASSKSTENNTKIWQTTTDWGMGIIDVDEQIASGSLISYQGDCGSGVSSAGTTRSFDLGRYASMSKRSKSTSLSSFSTEDIKLESDEEAGKGNPEDFISSSKKDVATAVFSSPTLDSSVCSGEPLLSLKLGKRAYFEDTSDGSNTSNFPPLIVKLKCPPAPAPDTTTATTSAKRIRSSIFHSTPAAPCCQVEGCNLDLSSAKDYHRKHKVCAIHSKSPKVIVNGAARRFCQQCSRFHGLAEFDENKRSCRKRLSDHNGRRRRPQHHPNGTHFNPLRLSTIIYGSVQSKGMLHHHHHLAAATAATVTATHNHGNMLLPDSSMRRRRRRTVTALSDGGSYGVLPPLKGGATVVKIHGGGGGGLEESSLISSSSMDQDAPTKEFHRAPSLLSNDARDSYLQPPRSVPVASARDPPPPHPLQNTTTGMVKPWTYRIPPQSSPLGSGSELWHAEQWLLGNSSERQTMTHHHHNNNNNGIRRRSSSSHSFENSSSIMIASCCLRVVVSIMSLASSMIRCIISTKNSYICPVQEGESGAGAACFIQQQ